MCFSNNTHINRSTFLLCFIKDVHFLSPPRSPPFSSCLAAPSPTYSVQHIPYLPGPHVQTISNALSSSYRSNLTVPLICSVLILSILVAASEKLSIFHSPIWLRCLCFSRCCFVRTIQQGSKVKVKCVSSCYMAGKAKKQNKKRRKLIHERLCATYNF